MNQQLLACRTAEEVADYYRSKLPAPTPERSAARRPDGTRVTDSGTIKATLAWRQWRDGYEARSIAAVYDFEGRERIAAKAGRPGPRWSDAAKPVTILHGADVAFESGPGGALRRVTAPSHVPGGPRAVSQPVHLSAAERHRRSEQLKARYRARQRAARPVDENAAFRRLSLGGGGVFQL